MTGLPMALDLQNVYFLFLFFYINHPRRQSAVCEILSLIISYFFSFSPHWHSCFNSCWLRYNDLRHHLVCKKKIINCFQTTHHIHKHTHILLFWWYICGYFSIPQMLQRIHRKIEIIFVELSHWTLKSQVKSKLKKNS